MKSIYCATLDGIEAKAVDVEVSFVRALPSFSIVGLANTSIQESKERIKAALSAIDFKFPPQKVTVNLSPSDIKKEGSHFDLPIALLVALQKESIDLKDTMAFGELGLDGSLKDTSSLFAIILSLANSDEIKRAIIPKESLEKLSKIPSLKLYPASNLKEAIEIAKNIDEMKPISSNAKIDAKYIDMDQRYYYIDSFKEDFADVKGQERAKRASLIAAVGMHNILFEGSPGCGKSMCAKRVRYILPPMSLKEILYIAKLDSITQKEPSFLPIRPYRSPHHSSTKASIFGGGSKRAKIGEVGLAHLGELFFDELPHFPTTVLESLREPLQDHRVLISRVDNKIEYPTEFLFCSAMNPCPCGNLLSKTKTCRCTDVEIKRYKNRLSAPLLDRIEIYVQMDEITSEDEPTISSKEMQEEVLKAFAFQKRRGQKSFNSKLDDKEIERFCLLESGAKEILDRAIDRYKLTQRGVKNLLKVSRSISDLKKESKITKPSLLEALSLLMKGE
jgi:magnesium chelatase family protein